jgi:hypothetical protein
LEPFQPIEVKGKTEPVPIYKVIGTLPRRSPIANRGERILSPFVGRERELATLEAVFAQVEAGQGQVVGIVADAGGGKSRLLYEFRQRLQDKRVTYLEGRCLSYGSSIPYHPLIDVLRHNCDISETESPETSIEKVRFALQEVGMDVEASAPYLLQLLGIKEGTASIALLTPEAIRTRTFDTLKQMSLKGSQQHPGNLTFCLPGSRDLLGTGSDGAGASAGESPNPRESVRTPDGTASGARTAGALCEGP